jgi:transketolase
VTYAVGDKVALRQVFGETLVELGGVYPDLLVLDGDLANSTLSDRFAQAYPDRFLAMGIAEQNMAGVAAGLATIGFTPWLSTFAAFAAKRDLDQIRVVIAQPALNVKIQGAYSGLLTGFTGKTHQSVQDIAVFRAMPNMIVLAPADATEARLAMHAATDYQGPVYLRLTRDPSPVIFGPEHRFEIGRGYVVREGSDVTIISTGVQTTRALEAVELLASEGITAHLLHLPTLKPIDEQAVVEAAARTGAVVTAEDHTIIGGLGGAVAEVLGERCPTPMRRVGIRDVFGESGPNDALLEKYGLTARHVAAAARELLAGQRAT